MGATTIGGRAFGAFIDIESSPEHIQEPSAVVQKPSATPSAFELDQFTWGARYNGPDRAPVRQASWSTTGDVGKKTPNTTVQASKGLLLTPGRDDDAVEVVQSFFNPRMNKFRVLSACMLYLTNGMTDSAPGALLPYMEAHYNIRYGVVALIFVTQAVGFITVAFVSDWINRSFGRSKTLMLSVGILIAGYATLLTTPPFGAVVFAYFLIGFGEALNLALNNTFCSNLANSTTILGLAHGSYGIGGILAPIIATKLVSSGQIWSRFYYITLGASVIGLLFAGWAFHGYEHENPARLHVALERVSELQAAQGQQREGALGKARQFFQALNNRVTLTGALFIFAYQGAEVSISGWVISFLINYRHGDPSRVGYVTAGFWGGITVGRFVLSHVCHRVTERLSVYVLTLCAIAMQLLVWFVPNVVGDAVAVSLIGLVLGPVYPCGVTVFSRLLPREKQLTSLSFIGSAGSSGGAVAPFLTGMVAQAAGTWVLHPICIGMFVVMLGSWFCLPKVEKRDE